MEKNGSLEKTKMGFTVLPYFSASSTTALKTSRSSSDIVSPPDWMPLAILALSTTISVVSSSAVSSTAARCTRLLGLRTGTSTQRSLVSSGTTVCISASLRRFSFSLSSSGA